MTTPEQLAILDTNVQALKVSVDSLETRLFGDNGDGVITRLRLVERSGKNRLWLERWLFGGVGLLIMERIADWVMTAPPGAALPLAVPL